MSDIPPITAEKKSKRRKPGKLKIFLIVSLAFFLAITLILFTGLWIASKSLDSQTVQNYLVEKVERQTGGRLYFKSLSFDLCKGLRIQGAKLYPPDMKNFRGYINNGPVLKEELFSFEEIRINYNLKKLLMLKLEISAIQLIGPKVFVKQTDTESNYDGIIAYRKKFFPNKEVPEEKGKVESFNLEDLPNLGAFFIPLNISMEHIGFQNLMMELDLERKDKSTQISIHGLNLDIFVKALLMKSDLGLSLKSSRDNLIVSITEGREGKKLNKKIIKTDFNIDVGVKNFKDISLGQKMKVFFEGDLEGKLKPIGSNINVNVSVEDRFKNINLKTFKLNLDQILTLQLKGGVKALESDLSLLDLNLSQNLNVDLGKIGEYLKEVIPDQALSGEIKLENIKLDGEYGADAKNKNILIPKFSGLAKLNEVSAQYKKQKLRSVNGKLKFTTEKTEDSLTNMDIQGFLTVESLKKSLTLNKKSVEGGIEDLKLDFATSVLYPSLDVSNIRLDMSTKAALDASKNQRLEIPISLDLKGSLKNLLEEAKIILNLQLGEYLGIAENVVLKGRASSVDLQQKIVIDDLSKYKSLIDSANDFVNISDFVPREIQGKFSMLTKLKSKHPSILELTKDFGMKKVEVNYVNDLKIEQLSLSLPLKKIKTNNLDLSFSLNGDLNNQRVIISLEAPKVSMNTGKEVASIEAMEVGLDIDNKMIVKNAKDIPSDIESNLNIDLNLGNTFVSGAMKDPVKGVSFSASLAQESLKSASLKELFLKVPDLGFDLRAGFNAKVNKKYEPKSLSVELETTLAHVEGGSLPFGVKTKGKITSHHSLDLIDGNELKYVGGLAFEHFSLQTKNKNNDIRIDDINGEIPLKQRVEMASLLGKGESKKGDVLKNFKQKKSLQHMLSYVDYEEIRSFYPSKNPIYIKSIDAFNLSMKNIEFDAELSDGRFSINQYYFDFLDGKVHGNMRLDFDLGQDDIMSIPQNFKTSLQTTKLDTYKLVDKFPKLKKKVEESFSLFGKDTFIDSTTHLSYDFLSSDVAGAVEITSIGKEQVKMMLSYLDPEEKNKTISDMRTAVNLGEVKQVSIPIKNGEVGLMLDVRSLGVPLPVPDLKNIPISQIINSFKPMKNTQEGESNEDGI